jgi:hypothetical protein
MSQPPASSAAPPGRRALVNEHVALNITTRCNQRCIFCFEGTRDGWAEPDLAQTERLLDDARQRGTEVIFMGGEALVRRDILDVVRHGAGIGLRMSAFTNGIVLAREGFVPALARAGLAALDISAHYADAASYERGAGMPARQFERFLAGLRNVRDHNRAFPGERLEVTVETELFRYNAGALAGIHSLLLEHLGDSYATHRLGTVAPMHPEPTRTDDYLFEPLAARRAELERFIADFPPGRRLVFSKVPLCLVPGAEHQSLDVVNKVHRLEVLCNFQDKGALAQMHTFEQDYREAPYRWVCRDCSLLALCPVRRTRWGSARFGPRRDQRPIPFVGRRPEEVLGRIPGIEHDPRGDLDGVHAQLLAVPVPEASLVAGLRGLSAPGLTVGELWCEPDPLLTAAVTFDGGEREVRFAPIRESDSAPLGHLVRFWNVTLRPATDPARDEALLQRLAAAPLGSPDDWEGSPLVPAALARGLEALSGAFGARLWPGIGTFGGGWRTAAVRPAGRELVLSLEGPGEARATLRLAAGPRSARPPVDPAARVVLETAGLRATLTPDGTAADPPAGGVPADRPLAALTGELRRLLAAHDGPVASPAPPGAVAAASGVGPGAPSAAPDESAPAAPQPAAEGLQDRPGALRIVFRDRRAVLFDHVFFVGAARTGEALFRRVGAVGISHLPAPDSRALDVLSRLVVRAAELVGAPPDEGNHARWEAALRRLAERTNVTDRFEHEVGPAR